MAIVKKIVKGISATVGEILVVGGALGTAYVLGFVKGSDLKAKIGNAIDGVANAVNTTTKTEEEPATEQEAESTTEEDAPPIEVCVNNNNQPED